MKYKLGLSIIAAACLFACNSGSTTPSAGNNNGAGQLLSCWPNVPANPKQLSLARAIGVTPQIFGGCNTDMTSMSLVEKMTVALSTYNADTSAYASGCSATPIQSTSNGNGTYTTWFLSAAHCFQTGNKESSADVTVGNFPLISTPSNGANDAVFTGASPFAQQPQVVSSIIKSLYAPANYCAGYDFESNGCSWLTDSSNDIILLKGIGESFNIVVKLASDYPPVNTSISQSGYGRTTYEGTDYGSLYYATAWYAGAGAVYSTNGESGQLYTTNTFANGQSTGYVGTTCHGDSGSGVFYWQNNQWYIFGDLAALRYNHCGQITYWAGVDNIQDGVSVYTDVIKFAPWLTNIMQTGNCSTANNCVESDAQ